MKNPIGSGLRPGEPLWRRVPSRDGEGRPLFDFMMLIPGLNRAAPTRREQLLLELRQVLAGFDQELAFVDLNLRTSLLWVSIRPRQGVMTAFATALRERIPEARLIANQADLLVYESMGGAACRRRRPTLRGGIDWGRRLLGLGVGSKR